MFIVNIDEKIAYQYKHEFAEDLIYAMFKEYFNRLYTEKYSMDLINEMQKKVSIKIPKKSIFIEKSCTLYAINLGLNIEVAPEDFFIIDENSHPILIECFEKCCIEFKKLIKNYKTMQNSKWFCNMYTLDSTINVLYRKSHDVSVSVESFENGELEDFKINVNKILNISLVNSPMCERICSKIVELYKDLLFKNQPFMFINVYDEEFNIKYTVADKDNFFVPEIFFVEEVRYSIIERELEKIIHEVISEDTDFLVNRIYNYMFNLKTISNRIHPSVRINRLGNGGASATLYLKEKNIPIVFFLDRKYEMYALLKNENVRSRNKICFPTSKQFKYENKYINAKSVPPEDGVKYFKHIHSDFFKGMSCYLKDPRKTYCDKPFYITYILYKLYKLENGVIKEVTKEMSEFYEEQREACKKGSYTFWQIDILNEYFERYTNSEKENILW